MLAVSLNAFDNFLYFILFLILFYNGTMERDGTVSGYYPSSVAFRKRLISANNSKHLCPALRYPIPGVVLQVLVTKDVLSSDPALGSRDDFPSSRPRFR